MDDGRGANTSYINNGELNSMLNSNVNATNELDYRMKLQQNGQTSVDDFMKRNLKEFQCDKDPHGEVKLNPEINLITGGGNFKDQFKYTSHL
jgi:predicted metalloprotease with PDZ domain